MSKVGRGLSTEMLPLSEVVADVNGEGMAKECILAVGQTTGLGVTADGTRRPPGQLISRVPTEFAEFLAHSKTEDMPVRIRHHWVEIGVGHRVLTVHVTAADAPIVSQITRHPEIQHPAWLPIEGQR